VQTRTWLLGSLIYEVKLEKEGEIWFYPVRHIHTPLSPLPSQFLSFAPYKLSRQKKAILRSKNIGGSGNLSPLPTQVTPMDDGNSL